MAAQAIDDLKLEEGRSFASRNKKAMAVAFVALLGLAVAGGAAAGVLVSKVRAIKLRIRPAGRRAIYAARRECCIGARSKHQQKIAAITT
jgi:hypothetical protein